MEKSRNHWLEEWKKSKYKHIVKKITTFSNKNINISNGMKASWWASKVFSKYLRNGSNGSYEILQESGKLIEKLRKKLILNCLWKFHPGDSCDFVTLNAAF